MNDRGKTLHAYLRYVYDYYVACVSPPNNRPTTTAWGAARLLVELLRRAGELSSGPPWGVQFLPSNGMLRVSAGYVKDMFRLSADDYFDIRNDLYAHRSGFFVITTKQTAKLGWKRIAKNTNGAWSGAVFNAVHEETLYFLVTTDKNVIDRCTTGDLQTSERGAWLAREWDQAALGSLGMMPLYWVGTDVTALLGGTARLGMTNDRILVPRDSQGYVERDPTAREAFEAIVTVLTNPTGLYFEERKDNIVDGPLYPMWRDIARTCRTAFRMPRQRVQQKLSDERRISQGAKILKEKIVGDELQLLANWVAFQVHHENIMHLFWDKERNTMDDLQRSWDACEPLGMQEHLQVMRRHGITIAGEAKKRVPSTWSGERFGVAYLAWSLAKGCGLSRQWPNNLTYCVHRQRRHCVPADMTLISTEREELVHLFPWGAILQGLHEELYRETAWLSEVLTTLRQRTIEHLGGLETELAMIGASKTSISRKHWLQTETVHDFAHQHLTAVLPGIERFYPADRRLNLIAALTAAREQKKRLAAQEEQWLSQARTAYHGTYPTSDGDDRRAEHHPAVLDYQNTIIDALRTGDDRLEAYLVNRGYLRA